MSPHQFNSTIQTRALKNTVVGYVSFVLSLLQTIILVPVLLGYWGKTTYGIWLALFAGFTLLQTLDFGHQNYVGNKFNLLYHTDKNQLHLVLGSSLLIAYLLGAIELLIVFTLIFSDTLFQFLGVSMAIINNIAIEWSLLALIFMWFLFGSAGGILVRLLIPVGMLYQMQWWGIFTRFTQFISLVIVAIYGGKIFIAAIFYSIVQSTLSIIVIYYIKKKIPEFYPWWKYRSFNKAFSNLKNSLILTVNSIVQQLGNNGLILFVAHYFSAAIVPAFTTIRTITNSAGSITNVSVNSLLPEIVRYHAKREDIKIKNTIYTNWFISGAIVNFGIILILPFIEKMYIIWTKGQLSFDYVLFLFLISSISFVNFGSGLLLYLTGINNLFAQTTISIIRVVVIFALSIFFIDIFGLAGIGFGILISEIICSAILPVIFVNRELVNFSTGLDNKFIILAALSPMIILCLSLLLILSEVNTFLIISTTFILLIIINIHYWKNLDKEVKMRLKDLTSTLLRKLFFK